MGGVALGVMHDAGRDEHHGTAAGAPEPGPAGGHDVPISRRVLNGAPRMLFRKASVPPQDRRLAPRRTVQLEAEIALPGGRALTCTTVDLSASGARVKLRAGILLPDTFSVSIPRTAKARPARLVWRSDEMIGLHYV